MRGGRGGMMFHPMNSFLGMGNQGARRHGERVMCNPEDGPAEQGVSYEELRAAVTMKDETLAPAPAPAPSRSRSQSTKFEKAVKDSARAVGNIATEVFSTVVGAAMDSANKVVALQQGGNAESSTPAEAPAASMSPEPVPNLPLSFSAAVTLHETFPVGSTVPGGASFVKAWKVQNTGHSSWPADLAIAPFGSETNVNVFSCPGKSLVTATITRETADLQRYAEDYIDVAEDFGTDEDGLWYHWSRHGANSGRIMHAKPQTLTPASLPANESVLIDLDLVAPEIPGRYVETFSLYSPSLDMFFGDCLIIDVQVIDAMMADWDIVPAHCDTPSTSSRATSITDQVTNSAPLSTFVKAMDAAHGTECSTEHGECTSATAAAAAMEDHHEEELGCFGFEQPTEDEELWAAELSVLRNMGFTCTEQIIPILKSVGDTPVLMQRERNGVPSEETIMQVVSMLVA
jgi:hypothetical protein